MATGQAQEKQRRLKGRSPSYPGIDLETAIERSRVIWQKERQHPVPVNTILGHWGYTPNSGLGLVTLAALKKFGLVVDQGSGKQRQARLTDLARKIILDDRPNSQERFRAIQEAALTPAIHAELWKEYDGSLPSDENLKYQLRLNRAFTDTAIKELIPELRSTFAFAKLGQSDIMGHEEDEPSLEGEVGGITMPMTPTTERDTSASQSGRRHKQVFILPLSGGTTIARLEAELPMSEKEWNQMLVMLNAMKPGLVAETSTASEKLSSAAPAVGREEKRPRTRLSAEAQDVIKKVDGGGVPMYTTPNLERLAKEHGLEVTNETTPNEIIEKLRALE